MNLTGKLYLIPTPISDTDYLKVLPQGVIDIIFTLDEFIVEELRTARRFLKKIGYAKDFEEVTFHLLNEHTKVEETNHFLDHVLQGKNMGLLSEAGCPCIADPGNVIVRLAHEKKIQVVPLTGPSSILLSLIASGFNGQNFAFTGYLPIEKNARIKRIRDLERLALSTNQTQIFMEAPYRNIQLLQDIIKTCREDTMLCIATEITSPTESIISKPIYEWKNKTPDINKKNTVFLIYKNEFEVRF